MSSTMVTTVSAAPNAASVTESGDDDSTPYVSQGQQAMARMRAVAAKVSGAANTQTDDGETHTKEIPKPPPSRMDRLRRASQAATTPAAPAESEAPAAQEKPAEVAAAPEPSPDDGFRKRFEDLTSSEKASREAAKEARTEREALEQARKALARTREIEDLIASGKGTEALAKVGVNLDQVAQWHLNEGKPDPHKEVESHREQVKAEMDALRNELASMRAERQVEGWRGELTREIASAPDDYEFVTVLGLQDEIENHAAQYYNETQKLLTPREAAATVRDRYEALVLKLKGSKKAQALLGVSVAKDPSPPQKAPKVPREPKPQISEAATIEHVTKPLSRHERLRAVAAKFSQR